MDLGAPLAAIGRDRVNEGAAAMSDSLRRPKSAGADPVIVEGAGAIGPIVRDNLMTRVFDELRGALMEGRFPPGHRFKIREVALTMNVSDTPVREALMQLVCERGLTMDTGRAITVPKLTLAQYLELRKIRFQLESMATEAAAKRISQAEIARLREIHGALVAAEKGEDWPEAVRTNWLFHHGVYRTADMPELLALIEQIWLRNGPLLNYLYPHARPTYAGRHQHLNVLAALSERDSKKAGLAIKNDMIEGGATLIKLLENMEKDDDVGSKRLDARSAEHLSPRPGGRSPGRTSSATPIRSVR
jgi:DNA-binding GntR family transcriptional regulator